ncbi:MAG: copper resistance protein NlpE [Methylococcales bacterium]
MQKVIQQFKQCLMFSLFIAVFSGHSPVFAETAVVENGHHAPNSLDWPGIYHGFTPCDDCMGIKTTLALNKNNSYILITQNVGKSPREIVEKGKFTWGSENNTVLLTARNSSTTRQYLVGENTLTQLDDSGNRITGKLAEKYVLRRTDVTEPTQPHAGH